jgi:membrane associated rhomboid family serine protease
MMPVGDDNSERKSVPIVTYGLIILNILFFLLELTGGEAFITEWAFVPSRFMADPVGNFPTIFTAKFMHAGFMHLFGNMLYLWIFGDNVEDNFGKVTYLIFYLLCGIAATFAQLFMNPTFSLPNLGASGAIAGVLGAYMYLRPQGQVNVLLGRSMTQLPALLVIGFWFFLQFISEIGSLASTSDEEGGVAYMAHIGGFIAGLAFAFVLNKFTGSASKRA